MKIVVEPLQVRFRVTRMSLSALSTTPNETQHRKILRFSKLSSMLRRPRPQLPVVIVYVQSNNLVQV